MNMFAIRVSTLRRCAGRSLCSTMLSLWAAVAVLASASEASTSTGRAWTLEDIVTVPEIRDVALSADGSRAIYIVRQADVATNRKTSTLHLIHLATGADQAVATGAWMQTPRNIPGSDDWSVLADLGQGVQLYRVDRRGQVTALVVNTATATLGMADGATWLFGMMEAPVALGILSYSWSPDGRTLWYERPLPESPSLDPLVDDDAVRAFVPWWPHRSPGRFEFRMRRANGEDVAIVQRSVPNYTGFYSGGAPVWSETSDAVLYTITEEDARGETVVTKFIREIDASESLQVDEASPLLSRFAANAIGPRGGRLSVEGWGDRRKLVETSESGAVHAYGTVGFRLGGADSRVPRYWRSPDGRRVVMGVRYLDDNVRSGVVVLDRRRGLRAIDMSASLTACDFTRALSVGICVRQGMTLPPELVRVDPVNGSVKALLSLAPRHAEIAPLRVEPRVWSSSSGHQATGFVIYPRNYELGKRYPAILVTHGSDADQRFASADFQWDYPVQVLAEHGYVVLAVNEPAPGQDAELAAAYAQWTSAERTMAPERVQDLVWFASIAALEAAVKDLSASGIVDADRVGIAGYSRGSQVVNVAMTRSTLFKAGSSGDGGYLEPAGYYSIPSIRTSYRSVFGGSPYEAAALENYRRLSPTFRAAQVSGPLLQQIASPHQSRIELFDALRAAGKPTQITLYRGETQTSEETHLFHIPSNRLAAMQENLDWFDFWLRDRETEDAAKAPQYQRWREMRDLAVLKDRE